MPKILGLNSLGVLLASVAFFFVGFLWYAVIFSDAWMAAHGVTVDDAGSPLLMVAGFVITVMQVVGIGLVLKWKNVSGIAAAVQAALLLWVLFAIPLMFYDLIYLPGYEMAAVMIDISHLLVGWVISAVVLSLIK